MAAPGLTNRRGRVALEQLAPHTTRSESLEGLSRNRRAQQLALELAMQLPGRFTALVAGTDGTDGPTDAAGAVVDEQTLGRGREAGLDARVSLDRFDAYTYLGVTGDRLHTGPTDTNVSDLVLIHVDREMR